MSRPVSLVFLFLAYLCLVKGNSTLNCTAYGFPCENASPCCGYPMVFCFRLIGTSVCMNPFYIPLNYLLAPGFITENLMGPVQNLMSGLTGARG